MLLSLARRWRLLVLRGAFAVLFGVLALAWPELTLVTLVVLWGAYAVLDGVVALVLAVTERTGFRGLTAVLGALGVIAGVVALLWPGITAVALLTVIAVWAVAAGLVQVVTAVRLRKVIENEWFLGVTGALSVALGVVLLVDPAVGALAVVVTIGAFALLWGVSLVLFGLKLRGLDREHARAV